MRDVTLLIKEEEFNNTSRKILKLFEYLEKNVENIIKPGENHIIEKKRESFISQHEKRKKLIHAYITILIRKFKN